MSTDTMPPGQYGHQIPASAAYSQQGNLGYDHQEDMDPEGYYTNQPVSSRALYPKPKAGEQHRD